MVEFFKKASSSKDLVLSQIFADLYDGRQETARIGGGRKEQAYLSRYTIPPNPVYGSAELSRIDYNIYVNSIDLATNVYAFPEGAIYKTKDASRISLTEGVQQVDHTAMDDIVVFTSHIDGFVSISDNFDGESEAYSDGVEYIPVQKQILRAEQPYITPSIAYSHGREGGFWGESAQDYTYSEIKKGFAYKASELGITNLDENALVIPVKGSQRTNQWTSAFKWKAECKPGMNFDPIYTKGWVLFGVRNGIAKSDLYGDEMTPSNTIFEIIRGKKEFLGEQTKGESGVELLATGVARFSTDTSLTGAQSGELYTFWKKDATEVVYPALGSFTGVSPSGSQTGATERQEVMICKKNIPFPIKHPAKPYRRAGHGAVDGQDANDFSNNIEIDINIKSLEKAFTVGTGGPQSNSNFEAYTLRRSLVICFSEEPPAMNESLFEFVWRHRDTSGTQPAGSATGVWNIQSKLNDTENTNAKSFAAVAFLNTDKGLVVANAGISIASPGGYLAYKGENNAKQWVLDEVQKDILYHTSNITRDGQELTNQWIRLNFLFPGQSESDKEITTANASNHFAVGPTGGHREQTKPGWGTHCKLVVSQVSDGTIIKNTANFGSHTEKDYWDINNITNRFSWQKFSRWPKHLSIWLCNYKADVVTPDKDILLDKNVNTSSQVFIDKIEFKDFNYSIDNPNMKERNLSTDQISIHPADAYIGPDGRTTEPNDSDNISKYLTNSPTIMSIGVTDRANLGWIDFSANSSSGPDTPDAIHKNWTSDQKKFMYFHNISTPNLSSLKEIPDANMIATYTHAGGDEYGGGGAFIDSWGQCVNSDYGLEGHSGGQNKSSLKINNFESIRTAQVGGSTNIGLKVVPTKFSSHGTFSDNLAAGSSIRLQPSHDDYLGRNSRTTFPIRKGDTVVWPHADSLASGDSVQRATVSAVTINSIESDDIDIQLEDIAADINTNNEFFIELDGLVKNWSQKGLMYIDLNDYTENLDRTSSASAIGSDSPSQWARREAATVSARFTDIVSHTDHTCKIKVDTIVPFLLEKDEEFFVYLYGDSYTKADFAQDDLTGAEIDATCDNARKGILVTEIDREDNIITLDWNGMAEDTSTKILTKGNVPRLFISPHRYWMHINIDCSEYSTATQDNVDPSSTITYMAGKTLPVRNYSNYSVMKNNFAIWDGSSYYTALVNQGGTVTNNTSSIIVDAHAEFTVGDTIQIDDEVMIIRSINTGTNTLTVWRGMCGTYSYNAGNYTTSTTPDTLTRYGDTHADDSKIKKVNRYAASGEELTNVPGYITGSGILSTLAFRRNLGSTYNEFLINYDVIGGINGPYVNTWLPTVLSEGSILDVDTDFGFGSYDEDEDVGGNMAQQIMTDGQYNEFKLLDIKNASDFVVNNDIDLLLRYRDDTVPHVTNITTRLSDTNTPFIYAVYEDIIPQVPTLSVAPNEEDAFLPEFTWEASDDDLWYGLLHINDGQIDNQYTNKVAHIPLNENNTSYEFVFLENESNTKVAAAAGTFTNTKEGLAGFAKDFDEGSANYIKFATFTDTITSEMTVVVHIIPDNYTNDSYILNQSVASQTYSDWEIKMDSSRQIVAKLLPVGSNSNPVTLTSTPIRVDGETPTCIILTFDKNLKSGNCKLFINGKIEDQSGLIKATPTINNWKNDTNLLDSSGPLFIGCDVNSNGSTLSSHFDGKIEEIVIYNKCLYPVVPSDGKFIFTKPVTEISNQTALSYSARLFVKDYHNIRGSTVTEVAASSSVSYRKAAFRLVD